MNALCSQTNICVWFMLHPLYKLFVDKRWHYVLLISTHFCLTVLFTGLSDQFEALQLHNHKDPTSTLRVTSRGGELCIPGTGIHLFIPEGAIPAEKTIDITLSLPLDRDPPPLDDDHLMITPIVKCKPDGFRFLKPVELTLPLYAGKVDPRKVTLWTKSSSTGKSLFCKLNSLQMFLKYC